MSPNFDEIVGSELGGAERDRLRRIHELLVVAGPPPELSPELERAPIPGAAEQNVRALRRKSWGRRGVLLLAAAILVAIAFIGGLSAHHGGSGKVAESLQMQGTAFAPQAQGQLVVYRQTAGGNWPMKLVVTGLPKLQGGALYDVYLVRNGKLRGSCGTFTVGGSTQAVPVPLNSPYALKSGDSWVVTRERPGENGPGPTVLKPGSL